MNMNCRLSDAIARIKNAKRNDSPIVEVLWSKKVYAVLSVLKSSGVAVKDLEIIDSDGSGKKFVERKLLVYLRGGKLYQLDVVSTPGRVNHVHRNQIPTVKNGFGIVVISTSAGMMTGVEAKASNLGGKIMAIAF